MLTIDQAQTAGLVAECHVLRYGHMLTELWLLVDDADPGGARLTWASGAEGGAVQSHRGCIRAQGTCQNAHEGALAGAVFTQHGVHLARCRFELDPVQCLSRAERLTQSPHRESRHTQSALTLRATARGRAQAVA